MKVRVFSCLLPVVFLFACGGEWVAEESSKVSCDISDVPFSTAQKISLSADGEKLYILDRYGHAYAYSRNEARTCAYELDRTPENPDGEIPVSMAENIEKVGSFLYYYDGISVLRYDDAEFSCDISLNAFALTPSFVYYAPSAGLGKNRITATGCVKTNVSFSAARVMTLDASADRIVTVETSGALSDPPQRLVIYDEEGNALARSALAADDVNNSLHFCSATRVRFGAAFVALLDVKCGNLGVFSLDGELMHRLDLSEMGIRNAVDMDIARDDLFLLTSSSVYPLYFLDFSSFAFGEERM